MEPQAESVSYMSIEDVMEVYIPEDVKYCPYTGSYEQMIHKAMNDNNLSMVRSLIKYRDDMNNREKKIKELYKNYPEHDSHTSGATVN